MRGAVAVHPNTSIGTLEQLLSDGHDQVRSAVQRRRDIPAAVLTLSCQHRSHLMRALAAAHPDCTPEMLERLAADGHLDVRAVAASRSRIPADTLAALAGDRAWQVRREVASNSSCGDELLVRLAAGRSSQVRVAVERRRVANGRRDPAG